MSNHPFKKFIGKKSNAAIKEKHKQDKKAAKRKRAEEIEKHFSEKRAKKERQKSSKEEIKLHVKKPVAVAKKSVETMPLNKFLSHCNVSSRREAVEIIKDGGCR